MYRLFVFLYTIVGGAAGLGNLGVILAFLRYSINANNDNKLFLGIIKMNISTYIINPVCGGMNSREE